jgi:hypothetical protein
MATTVIDCGYINPGATEGLEKLVHTGAGRLLGMLVSSPDAAAQTVTFYDKTTATAGYEFLEVAVPAGVAPVLVMFPRNQSPTFSTGLYIEPNSALVAIWAILYS